jgi:hypothetical protein
MDFVVQRTYRQYIDALSVSSSFCLTAFFIGAPVVFVTLARPGIRRRVDGKSGRQSRLSLLNIQL